jgi:hypothetical protein
MKNVENLVDLVSSIGENKEDRVMMGEQKWMYRIVSWAVTLEISARRRR